MAKRIHCEVISVPPQKMPVMPGPWRCSSLPSPAGRARASSSFGVVNMHLMSWPADRTVIAWSMMCSWYALRCSIQPFLMSLTTQRGSRSTQKQMPPRYWHRCSTASRSRRGPDGPSISQLRPLGEVLLRQRVAEHLVVDAEVVDDDAALGDAGGAAGLEDVDRLVLQRLGHPAAHRAAAQPLVLEVAEQLQVVEALHVLERVELERLGLLQPERRAGLGVEVPVDDLAHVGVELFAGLADLVGGWCGAGHGDSSIVDDGRLAASHELRCDVRRTVLLHFAAMAYSFVPLLTYSTPLAATGGTFSALPMSILLRLLQFLAGVKTYRSPSSVPM